MAAQAQSTIESRREGQLAAGSRTAERTVDGSPRLKARLAGVFEALEGLASAGGQVIILGMLLVAGDAAATANNILAHESLFRLGFAISLVAVVFHVAWALLFYDVFKVVNRTVALLATFIIMVGCTLQAITSLLYVSPLAILQGANALSGLTLGQLQALGLLFFKLNGLAFDTYLVFFGLWCILSGYLIFRSTFIPRILGVLLIIDGFGWATYLFPPLASQLFPIIALASAVAEIPLQLWLIVKGVDARRWKEQANALGPSVALE